MRAFRRLEAVDRREVIRDIDVVHEGGELGVQVALVVLAVVAVLAGLVVVVHHRLPFVDGMVSTRGSSSRRRAGHEPGP